MTARAAAGAGARHVALNAQLLFGRATYRSAGIHHYIDRLLRHLPEAAPDFRFTVFVGAGRPEMPGAAVRRTRLPTARPFVRIAWEQIIQPIEVARLRPDLLHGLAFVSPWLARVPSIVTVYDLSFRLTPDRFRPAQRLYLSAFTAAACRRARRVVAISESTRADVVRLLGVPAEKVDVAYPGVEPAFQRLPPAAVAAFRAQRGLPERFILYLGTLEPRKNLGALVAAFARLGAIEPGLHLVLAGGRGWWFERLFQEVQALGLAERVHFPGFVPNDELPLWYNAALAFAYPSSYEGFGLPVAEALACGCPVVTTAVSSLPEAGGEAAFLVPPPAAAGGGDAGFAAALAAALRQALRTGPDRAARGQAHAARFTWAATAQATASSYRHALSGAAPGRPA
jgi:glycosyltransferase involved in cell wall biosynthesis